MGFFACYSLRSYLTVRANLRCFCLAISCRVLVFTLSVNKHVHRMEGIQCLVATPFITVSHDPANNWLYAQWHGQHDEESVRISAEHIFACLARYHCLKMLSDHRLLTGNWQPAIPSVVQQNFERLAAHGVRYVGWVYSFEYSDLIAMERVVRDMAQPLVGLFDEAASAYDWLLYCPVDLPPPTNGEFRTLYQ